MPTTKPLDTSSSTVPTLSRRSFLVGLGITLAIFVALHPLWRPIDMEAMDRNIWWSYVPIPLIVAVLLALEHKLRWSSWALETMKLTLVKFALTFTLMNTIWSFVQPPPPAAESEETNGALEPEAAAGARAGAAAEQSTGRAGDTTDRYAVQPPPSPTPIDPARTGRIEGIVVDAAGAPRAGTLVAVTGGLQGMVFAPRAAGVILQHDGGALQPRRAAIAIHEPLVLRGAADRLHTVCAFDGDGRQLFNVPLLPGAERRLMFDRPIGRVRLRCTVDGEVEHSTELAVVGNPFAAWTGADGRFRFESVPAGALVVEASSDDGARARAEVSLEPQGAAANLRLVLP